MQFFHAKNVLLFHVAMFKLYNNVKMNPDILFGFYIFFFDISSELNLLKIQVILKLLRPYCNYYYYPNTIQQPPFVKSNSL